MLQRGPDHDRHLLAGGLVGASRPLVEEWKDDHPPLVELCVGRQPHRRGRSERHDHPQGRHDHPSRAPRSAGPSREGTPGAVTRKALLERASEVRHVVESIGRAQLERSGQHGVVGHGQAGSEGRCRRRVPAHLTRDDRPGGATGERRRSGEHLVGDARQRVLVRPGVERGIPADLLRAHVADRSTHAAGGREGFHLLRKDRLREAEVGEHRVASREEHIARLHVAMNDALSVCVREGLGQLARDPRGFVDGQRALAPEPVAQAGPPHVRHRIEDQAVGHPGIVQRQDPGVLQLRGRLDLGEEPLTPDDGRQLGLQDLQRDLALVLQILGEVDRRHPALAQLPLHAIPAFESVVQSGDRVGRTHARKMRPPPPTREPEAIRPKSAGAT